MAHHFPVVLFVPGIMFVLVGWWTLRRARRAQQLEGLGGTVAAALRREGLIACSMGAVLLVLAVPLSIAIISVT